MDDLSVQASARTDTPNFAVALMASTVPIAHRPSALVMGPNPEKSYTTPPT